MTKHRHRFYVSSWCGGNVTFRCRCGEERERKMDREELRRFREHMYSPKPKDNVHRVVHDFYHRFKNKDETWKYRGYDFMERVERWAKKYPGDVRVVGCDDGFFSSSCLVLIEGRAENAYMGTTVIYIPQCTGEPPTEFFLYPGHRGGLIAALQEIGREAEPRQKRQRKAEAAYSKWWASRPKPRKGKCGKEDGKED